MQVNVYEEDTTTLHCGPVDLREVFADDPDSFHEAQNELQRVGRYWLGGGSAPLFYITPARDTPPHTTEEPMSYLFNHEGKAYSPNGDKPKAESKDATEAHNRQLAQRELAAFKANPPPHLFCYPNAAGYAVTFMGDALSVGRMSYGRKWRDNFGGERQAVCFAAINGHTYSGTLYGTYIRAKRVKSPTR